MAEKNDTGNTFIDGCVGCIGLIGVLLVGVIVVSLFIDVPEEATHTPPQVPVEPTSPAATRVYEPLRSWTTLWLTDEFGDRSAKAAVSERDLSLRPMQYPYEDMRARIMVACNRVWIRFDGPPNINATDYYSGGERHRIRVKFDSDEARHVSASQGWQSKDVNISNDAEVIRGLAAAEEVAIAFNWFGQGWVAFQWALDGSSDAIRESCQNS